MSRQNRPGYKDAKGIIYRGFDGNAILSEGTTVPANSTTGYSPGGFFFKRAGTIGGQLYINEGTAASCAFNPISTSIDQPIVTAITTLAVTAASHGGRTILLSLLAGFTSTLPAATGTGVLFRFVIGIVNTSGGYIINTTGTDVYNGSVMLTVPGSTYATAAKGETFASTANKTITISGTTQGGATIGDELVVQDIQTGVWQVKGWLTCTTSPATVFSN